MAGACGGPAGGSRSGRGRSVGGIRALMVVSDEKRRMVRLELRNTDAKTVVRVEVDEPAARGRRPAGRHACSRSAATTSDARRAERILTGLGLRAVDPAKIEQPSPNRGRKVDRAAARERAPGNGV